MIEAIMFWNEQNNKSHWAFEVDPDWQIFANMIKVAAQAVGPAQTGTQVRDAKTTQPLHGVVEPMVLKMKPLADAEVGRVLRKRLKREFRRAILAQEPHAKMPVVGGPFSLLMPRRGWPVAWQIVQAVPVNAFGTPV